MDYDKRITTIRETHWGPKYEVTGITKSADGKILDRQKKLSDSKPQAKKLAYWYSQMGNFEIGNNLF